MKLHLDSPSDINVIQVYDDDGVVINDVRFNSSLIVSPDKLYTKWPVDRFEELNENHFADIVTQKIEIVLLGTGSSHRSVDPHHLIWFANRGMGLEAMDSRAACRTYNLLAGEGRSVAAALILDHTLNDR